MNNKIVILIYCPCAYGDLKTALAYSHMFYMNKFLLYKIHELDYCVIDFR